MPSPLINQIFINPKGSIRTELWCVYAVILLLNICAWSSALLLFQNYPLLMGTALLAFGLGLRHAVDADHIAAIDNVTRKLIETKQSPVGVGFFFALGHSTIVFLACLALAWSTAELLSRFEHIKEVGGLIGTLVSAFFLLIIGAINAVILHATYQAWRCYRRTGLYATANVDLLGPQTGLLGKIIRPIFRFISNSKQMYPLGFLFGLGFGTATEIALLGIAATQSAAGLSPWSILVFPLLFCAAMTLVDTLNGHLMIGAYGWAHAQPERKMLYNLTITAISVVTAVVIGSIQVASLVADKMHLEGIWVELIDSLSEHFVILGYGIIGLCLLTWAVSVCLSKINVVR